MKEKRICKKEGCNKEISGQGKTGLCRSCAAKARPKKPKEQYNCKLCNTEITKRSETGFCQPCSIKEGKGQNYIDGRTLKTYYCIEPDCDNEISYRNYYEGNKRCYSCASKVRWKDKEYREKLLGKNKKNYNQEKHSKHYCIELNCGNEIHYDTWKTGGKRCKSCSSKGELGSIFGKKHSKETKRKISLANGGTGIPHENSEYPAEFSNKLRLKIRKRDNFICQKCDITEEEHKIIFNRILSVHHINYDKYNCEEKNLISVCHKCNTVVNYNRKKWTKYFTNIINNREN